MTDSYGASVPDRALVNDAPAGHHPSGFDPSRSDPGDPGAHEWVAERLSARQLEALKVLASPDAACGGDTRENGLKSATLWSLNDFRRSERNIQAPLMCVSWEAGYDMRRYWGITDFGKAVLAQAMSAGTAETQSGSGRQPASAVTK